MDAVGPSGSFLLTQFREFYTEVIRLKRLIQAGTWVFSASVGGEGTPEQATTAVWQRLLSVLEHQSAIAGRSGGEYGSVFYREAQYVMAALADEVFLNLNWEGRRAWTANLLEAKLFDSHVAGELFFQKLERLLQNRDPVYIDLAEVYLLALALGFQGKFRGIDDSGQLDYYRRQLFSFISRRDPNILDESRRLFPEAYAHTLDEARARRFPALRKWVTALALLILVLLAVSYGLWLHLTADLSPIIQQLLVG